MPAPRPASTELRPRPAWQASLLRLGPGIVTGASDVDPALVLTATVVGAAYRYALLWVVILCVPFLVTVFAVSRGSGTRHDRDWWICCGRITAAGWRWRAPGWSS